MVAAADEEVMAADEETTGNIPAIKQSRSRGAVLCSKNLFNDQKYSSGVQWFSVEHLPEKNVPFIAYDLKRYRDSFSRAPDFYWSIFYFGFTDFILDIYII